ncbi:MAG: TraB/GumN family protein [Candidatus Woesearchaeota archaeon]
MNNLKIIGTSHIAIESINEIKNTFNQYNPDIVAIELDQKRLLMLVSKQKKQKTSLRKIFEIGLQGYLFYVIGHWAEKKLGDIVKVKPGTDMMTAFKLAKKNNKQVALIDQDIEITLKKLSKGITWKEKWNFISDIFSAFVLRKKEKIDFNLNNVPDEKVIKKLINKTKKKYPNIIRILVDERNKIMAKRLAIIIKTNPQKKIMAIVGAGHEKEMLELIKKYIKTIEIPNTITYNYNIQNQQIL